MLLNKISVLDKGFVALYSHATNGTQLQELQDNYFKTKINMRLLDSAYATFVVKMPILVKINMRQYPFNITITPPTTEVPEAYIPDATQIGTPDVNANQQISDYIKETTEALLLNLKGMPMDGVNEFIPQLLVPISTYEECIVSGQLSTWISFLRQKNMPYPIARYQEAIDTQLKIEWKNLEVLKKLV